MKQSVVTAGLAGAPAMCGPGSALRSQFGWKMSVSACTTFHIKANVTNPVGGYRVIAVSNRVEYESADPVRPCMSMDLDTNVTEPVGGYRVIAVSHGSKCEVVTCAALHVKVL